MTKFSQFLQVAQWSLLVLCVLLCVPAFAIEARTNPPSLDVILGRLSRSAELFRDAALQFASEETISWRGIGMSPGAETFEYLFIYDEQRGFQDYRTARFLGNRQSAPAAIVPSDLGVPMFLRSAYLWIFTFRESRWPFHRYRIVGEETLHDIATVQIEFEPIPPFREGINDWYGVAWIDPDMGQIVKVIAHERDDYKTMKETEATRDSMIVDEIRAEYETVTTEFTEEKNGLRFPGTVILDHSSYKLKKGRDGNKLRKKVLIKVEQTYRNYRFFSVHTPANVRSQILGASVSVAQENRPAVPVTARPLQPPTDGIHYLFEIDDVIDLEAQVVGPLTFRSIRFLLGDEVVQTGRLISGHQRHTVINQLIDPVVEAKCGEFKGKVRTRLVLLDTDRNQLAEIERTRRLQGGESCRLKLGQIPVSRDRFRRVEFFQISFEILTP